MEFVELKNTEGSDFDEAWKIYESSFPNDERRSLKTQKEVMKKPIYSFKAFFYEGSLVGIWADWDFEDFLFVEHLAIKESLRGKSIGTKMIKNYFSKLNKKIVWEVERPGEEIADRRIKYYKRLGLILNDDFDYIQPSYGEGKNPVPLFIMSYPERLSDSEFISIREKLHKKVYGLDKPILSLD